MKQNYYYVVLNKSGGILLDSGRMPFFWRYKPAKELSDKFHESRVVKVWGDDMQKMLNYGQYK